MTTKTRTLPTLKQTKNKDPKLNVTEEHCKIHIEVTQRLKRPLTVSNIHTNYNYMYNYK